MAQSRDAYKLVTIIYQSCPR